MNGERNTHYAEALIEAMAGSSWFKVPRAFLVTMPPDEAVVYAYLIDLCKQLDVHLRRKDGWFYCTVEKLERETGVGAKAQTRILQTLEENGYIHLGRRGVPPRRHVWIDADALADLLVAYAERAKDARAGVVDQAYVGGR